MRPIVPAARGLAGAVSAAVLAGLMMTPPAQADFHQWGVVSVDPVNWTPHVLDGTVTGIAIVGSVVVVGGDFSRIQDTRSGRTFRQPYLFAFDRRSGSITNFGADLDGPVSAMAAGPDGTVFVAGDFSSVNGDEAYGVARISVASGEVVQGFRADVGGGDVRTIAASGRWLYLGGTFTSVNGVGRLALARLNGHTGEVDGGFRIRLAAPDKPRTKVVDLAVSPDGRRLVVIGALSRVDGQRRPQIAMINTGGRRASVSPWRSDAYAPDCAPAFDTYLRAVDFAPNGNYYSSSSPPARGPPRGSSATARPGSRPAAAAGPRG
jgi:hypothetical protein